MRLFYSLIHFIEEKIQVINGAYTITEIGIYVCARVFPRRKCVVANARCSITF